MPVVFLSNKKRDREIKRVEEEGIFYCLLPNITKVLVFISVSHEEITLWLASPTFPHQWRYRSAIHPSSALSIKLLIPPRARQQAVGQPIERSPPEHPEEAALALKAQSEVAGE